jgi:hypothetical protein
MATEEKIVEAVEGVQEEGLSYEQLTAKFEETRRDDLNLLVLDLIRIGKLDIRAGKLFVRESALA